MPKDPTTHPATAIILAGGQSRRMGVDKASALLLGRPLLQWGIDALDEVVSEIIVVGSPTRALPDIRSQRQLRTMSDEVEDPGPLAGFERGLAAASHNEALLVAADMPLLRPALLELLLDRIEGGAAAVVPIEDGVPQVLCSAWQVPRALEAVRAARARGERSVRSILDDVGALLMPPEEYTSVDADGHSFTSADTPADLGRVATLLRLHVADG